MSKGTEFLSDSNIQREQEQPLESLISADKALLALQEEGDIARMAECLSARSITFIHLYGQTKDSKFLILAKSSASTAVELARQDTDKSALVIPLLGLGRIQTKMDQHPEASRSYKEAVENMLTNPPESHNRPAVLADIKIHLAMSEYKTGDKSALSRLKQAITDLENANEDSYNKNVWLSGAHMKLAEILVKDDPQESKLHLAKAKEIIDSDDRLTIRLKQWTELSQ